MASTFLVERDFLNYFFSLASPPSKLLSPISWTLQLFFFYSLRSLQLLHVFVHLSSSTENVIPKCVGERGRYPGIDSHLSKLIFVFLTAPRNKSGHTRFGQKRVATSGTEKKILGILSRGSGFPTIQFNTSTFQLVLLSIFFRNIFTT